MPDCKKVTTIQYHGAHKRDDEKAFQNGRVHFQNEKSGRPFKFWGPVAGGLINWLILIA
jgi:hypothetical protein